MREIQVRRSDIKLPKLPLSLVILFTVGIFCFLYNFILSIVLIIGVI